MPSIGPPHCDDVQGDEQHCDVLVHQSTLSPSEPSLENQPELSEDMAAGTEDGSDYVTWTVYIALAIPPEDQVNGGETAKNEKNKDSSTALERAHKAVKSYHIEYQLLPGDMETVKEDLILFGSMAKLYRKDDAQLLRTWSKSGWTWLGWAQDFRVRVDRDMLTGLLHQRIHLHVWNCKDKLCMQARTERLKGFRLLPEQLESLRGMDSVKTMVTKLRGLCLKKANGSEKTKTEDPFLSESESVTQREKRSQQKTAPQTQKLEASDLEKSQKTGTFTVKINPIRLMAGETSVTEHFPVCSAGVMEVLCNISLDKPLISDQLKAELNPLVVTILSATSMPPTPVPFHVLQERCQPAYCQYKFHDLKTHRTDFQRQSRDIYFDDVHVILTGLMSSEEVQEFLSGPPLEIEVHDRDRKLDEPPKPQATLGSGPNDDTKHCAAMPGKGSTNVNAHGVASLDLSQLLHGRTSLRARLPIKSRYAYLQPNLEQSAGTGMRGSKELVLQGHYCDANSTLKVKVELARPVSVKTGGHGAESCSGPFGRIVYLLSGNNSAMVSRLRSGVLRVNAAAFHLGVRSLENAEMALSNYRMNFQHNNGKDVDFLSGFHLLDERSHIFVLEGLKHEAVRRLWEMVPMKLGDSEEEQVVVLYNSDMGFSRRIYDSLDLSLRPIQLSKPLESITRNPLLYVPGRIPRPCLQALLRLNQLSHARRLREAVRCDLFPSADMIVSLSREFGTCGEWRAQADAAGAAEGPPTAPIRGRQHAPIDTHNTEYIRWKYDSQQKQLRDSVQENIQKVRQQSKQLQKPTAAPQASVSWVDEDAGTPVYMYSCQTLNSRQQAKALLRREMDKMPGRRFTTCQLDQSATVEPGDGTSVPGLRSAPASHFWISSISKSNTHPLRPDDARVEELKKPWRESILHANVLMPTLSRHSWGWDLRHKDFQLYRKPPPFFSTPPPTICLDGDRQHGRHLEKLPPVSGSADPPDCCSIPEFKCHMRGNLNRLQDILKDESKKYSLRKAGMALKNTVRQEDSERMPKVWVLAPLWAMEVLKPFPQLYVLNLSNDDTRERACAALAPGPHADCSLRSKNNVVPRHAPPPGKQDHM